MQIVRSHRLTRPGLGLLVACVLVLATPHAAVVAAPTDPLIDQTDARCVFGGSWLTSPGSGFAGGSQTISDSPGASVSIAFVGTGVDLLATTGPKSGIVSVTLDGGTPALVDLYAPDTAFQQPVFSVSGLDDALHVVRIDVTGTSNAASAGAFACVDAFRVSGSVTRLPVEQSDARIPRRGAWLTSTVPGLSGGSHVISNTGGDELAIAFNGSRLDLVSMTGPKFGIAAVSIDGGPAVDVNLYSADTRTGRVVFSSGPLVWGAHRVRVVCSGRSSSSAVDRFVGLDAVITDGQITQGTIRYEETEPRLGWNGDLHEAASPAYSAGRDVWAGPAWGAVAVAFKGSRFEWVARTGPQFGIASVSIDGGTPQLVDLYSADAHYQQVVYSTGDIPDGQHTAIVAWTGKQNPAASSAFVGFDAFDIAGELTQASIPPAPVVATFNYPWNRYIVVDKSDLRLYYVVDGALVASYPVATGRPSMPTPSAIWRIGQKIYTDPASVYGPRKMRMFRQSGGTFVYTAYAIHGTDTDSSIGTYASHGCIRMHNYDVLVFFDMVPLGTMVVTRN